MSSQVPPNSDVPSGDSESPARDRFQAAAAEKMEAGRNAPVERSLWKGGYSPRAMYGTWCIAAIVTVAALVLVSLYASEQQNVWLITGSAILIGWCFVIGLYLYRRLGMHYELTTQRFVHQVGILVRRTDRIEVIDMDDISYTQGIIQRMLGVGTITITGSDRSHPQLVIYGIDRVPEIASLLDDVRREERRRRSLHIEAI
ncbi:MAG: PH domain-containing protein [Planctomycetales bacterium]|nr:PH domain-containing protein [Planctomycetales bacterium]